ncbi:MAG: hypothetical protein KDC38_06190, partial [Planctomycetes bacterium]|nr:hypothetical protein [Planctomycetota bacterium]
MRRLLTLTFVALGWATAAPSASLSAQVVVVPPGLHATPITSGPAIAGLNGVIATADERLLIARGSVATGTTSELIEHDLVTGVTTSLIAGLPLGNPDRMLLGDGSALLGDGLVLADHNSMETAECCDGRVYRIDLDTLAVTTIAAGNPLSSPGDPFGIAQGLGGAFGEHLYVMDFEGASPSPPVLYRVLPDGTPQPFVFDEPNWPLNASPKDLAFDPTGAYGGDLFIADDGSSDVIWRVTPSGVVTEFAPFPR